MKRNTLLALLRAAALKHSAQLEDSKTRALSWGRHPDWPWNGVVMSAATLGGSARWDLYVRPRYEEEFSWAALGSLTQSERRSRLEKVGRFKHRPADWLEAVFQHVYGAGGPAGVRHSLAKKDARAVIAFWKSFPGMGDKYARNIMMDIYDPRFRMGHFAVDRRILALLRGLGYGGPKRYDAQEAFLNLLASDLKIESWVLDRLLYQNHDGIAKNLGSPSSGRATRQSKRSNCKLIARAPKAVICTNAGE